MPTNYTSLIQQAITNYANDGVGLYNAIKGIHTQAKAAGDSIVYPGGKTLNITVCLDNANNPQEIPLPDNVHFSGCTFNVTNNTGKEFYLFSLRSNFGLSSVTLSKNQLKKDEIVYGANNELDSTPKLIIINDQTKWTTRTEYDENNELVETPFYRKDILYVVGNEVQNDPITNYDSCQSSPFCNYINVNTNQKTFKSIIFRRTEVSSSLTNLIAIKHQYNVLLQNVVCLTPEQDPNNGIYHDECLNIKDSAKIILDSIVFNHTYSAIYHWGYGIRILNVWNTSISNLTACNPAKGVMGNENVNELTVENSLLNRVDAHCYGRNITCTNCTFRNTTNNYHIYNRVSSFFGRLIFMNCTFDNFLPVRIDSAYNAFTPFDLILENCTLNVASNHKSLLNTETMVSTLNPRPELHAKCLPKIIITNMHLNIPSTVTDFCFIKLLNNDYTGSIHYMNTFIVYVTEYNQAGSAPVTIYDVNQTVTLTESLTRITNISMVYNLVGGS